MFVCGSHLLPSFRTGQASVLASLTKRFWFPAKGSLGHNLVTLVKFQDPQNVLATHEQENCATVSSTPFCDLPINPNTFAGLVGKVRRKLSPEGGRKGGWRKSAPAGPGAQTRDLPRARQGSPAARQGGYLDKQAFPCL